MLGRVFGVADLLVVLLLLFLRYNLFLGWKILLLFVAYLVIKGISFWGDWNSVMDLGVGAYLFLMAIGLHSFIDWVSIAYMLQKGLMSLL